MWRSALSVQALASPQLGPDGERFWRKFSRRGDQDRGQGASPGGWVRSVAGDVGRRHSSRNSKAQSNIDRQAGPTKRSRYEQLFCVPLALLQWDNGEPLESCPTWMVLAFRDSRPTASTTSSKHLHVTLPGHQQPLLPCSIDRPADEASEAAGADMLGVRHVTDKRSEFPVI